MYLQKNDFMKKLISIIVLIISSGSPFCFCQAVDSTNLKTENWIIHAQSTSIGQLKPSFTAKYSGDNSIQTESERQGSQTFTLYLGTHLWKNAAFIFNGEVVGGSGLSKTLGLAAASNGETYRIGDPSLTFSPVRLFVQQIFSLSENKNYDNGNLNALKGYKPEKYLQLTVGKVSLLDFFDANPYSHDPRTQFSAWALFGNGAWDYPADTRGYTSSIILEYINPNTELRGAISLLPLSANMAEMNWRFWEAQGLTLELTKHLTINNKPWNLRALVYNNTANMGNYNQATRAGTTFFPPNIISTRAIGRTKFGFGISSDWQVQDNVGLFVRTGWSDGNNETWAFTEIDRSLSFGTVIKGTVWKRPNDESGLAFAISGLSEPHKNYLHAGGYGFIIGDGDLNYANEIVGELYYGMSFFKNIVKLTGFYQLYMNPAYNADRGPVNIFSLRLHIEK